MSDAASSKDKAMAKAIRSASSESYDLAGFTPASAGDLLTAAFGTPVEAAEMFRVTLVVGGGKKVRTAYGPSSDGLLKDVCASLDGLGFSEDRSAIATLECGGTYKHQHDTDKDLRFVHVFPRVDTTAAEAAAAAAAAEAAPAEATPPLTQLLIASPEAFAKLLARKVTGYSALKALLAALKATQATCEGAEASLARLETLPPDVAAVYESATGLTEKIASVAAAAEKLVDAGPLTKAEAEDVVAMLGAKAAEAGAAAAAAEAAGKPSRAEKLRAASAAFESRRASVAARPHVPVPVKHEKELKQLKSLLAELAAIEACRGLQSLETVKKLREKDGAVARVAAIEAANAGWFEDPEVVARRLKAASKPAQAGAKPGGGGSNSNAGGSGFAAAPARHAAKPGAAKPKSVAASNPWAALGSG